MKHALRRMTRSLTSAERTRIEAARQKMDRARGDLELAERERDLAILDAYNLRGNVSELAEAAGVSRQTIHVIVKRLTRES